MNTPCRSSFHQRLVARSGARSSTSRATASPAGPHLREGPRAGQARVDVHAARAGRLGEADQPVVGEHVAHDQRDLAHHGPWHAGDRVEVDAQLVRAQQVLRAHRVRVQVDAVEIDHPDELRRVAHDDLVGDAPGRVAELDRLYPRWTRLGRPLLVEGLLRDPLDEPAQRHRPAADRAENARRDGEEVVDQVPLGQSRAPGTGPSRGGSP